MGMAEIRDAFEAYASGELAEYELRSALRAEVETQPGSVHRYAAMAAALRRRNLISTELEAAVVSDMNAIVARTGTTVPPEVTEAPTRASRREPPPLEPPAAAPSIEGPHPSLPGASTPGQAASGLGSSASRGGAWDTRERLAEPEVRLAVGSTLRDRFELIEELGRGGMGVVYKAVDQREVENKGRDPHVAIKVLNEDFKRHPESARALQRESKKAMRLAHPNIVLVRDFDRDCGNVYMVMELLHGTPLDQLVLKQHPKGMPIDTVVEIVNGLGAALSYAHQQGIVHADFKPSNAFLTSQNQVKVLDFGVARVALALDRGESTLFDAGKLNAVSPAYASIEMLVGEAPDPRDDLYGLACVTYFLLTGRHPFSGIDAIKARDSALLPMPINGLADQQWRAIRQALTFERWDRTPSVKEFLAQFCIDASKRQPRLSRATKVATGATQLMDRAVKRPWLFAAPAGALLAGGLALLIVHLQPRHPAIATETRAPVALPQEAPASAVAVDSAAVTIASLKQRLASLNPGAADFLDQAVLAGGTLKQLDQLAPGVATVQQVRASVLTAMSRRVAYLLEHDNPADAKKLVARTSALLPPGALKSYSGDAFTRRQGLGHLVANAVSTQKWADQLGSSIRDVSAVAPPDDPLISDARETADTTFQLAAEDARGRHANDQAREFLAMGLSANDQSSALRRAALELAKDQPAAVPAPAPVAPVSTPTVTVPAAPAVATVAASAGVDPIVQQARQQMSAGNVDQALETIASGRRRFGGDTRLKDLEVTYDRVGEEHDRFNLAAAVNVKSHEEYLSEIHSLAGDQDYPAIEKMLAQALADDIAEQRLHADRDNVAEGLLQSGRALFPEYADLLKQGHAAPAPPAAATEASSQVAAEKPIASPATK